MEHVLKIWPRYFEETIFGQKTAQLRKADRPYAIGDTLVLREWVPESGLYTGRETTVTVTDLIEKCEGLVEGYCILSVKLRAGHAKRFVVEKAGSAE
jgi:hypothetical protein